MVMPFVAQDLGHIMKKRRLSDRIIIYLFYQLLRGLKVGVYVVFVWLSHLKLLVAAATCVQFERPKSSSLGWARFSDFTCCCRSTQCVLEVIACQLQQEDTICREQTCDPHAIHISWLRFCFVFKCAELLLMSFYQLCNIRCTFSAGHQGYTLFFYLQYM